MKMKLVRVKDYATDMTFAIGELDKEDEKFNLKGWVVGTKIIIILEPKPTIAMGSFSHPIYDLKTYGNIWVNHTTRSVAEIVRQTPFEELPDVIDVSEYILERK